MNAIKKIMLLYALSSVHVGSGDDLNYIDLPIQREKHTNFPKIEASSLKGSVRQAMGESSDVNRIMGNHDNGDIGSAVSFSDARLLFFPIKSAKGVFAYATCPLVINRFISDCKIAGITEIKAVNFDCLKDANSCALPDIKTSNIVFSGNKVVLDEFVFAPKSEPKTELAKFIKKLVDNLPKDYLTIQDFSSHVVMLSDDDFTYFVTNSTEVVTRIKVGLTAKPKDTNNNPDTENNINTENTENNATENSTTDSTGNDTKDGQNLFTQENLPPESILYSLLFFTETKKPQKKAGETNSSDEDKDVKVMSPKCVSKSFKSLFMSKIFQVGGDMTLGKGLFYKTLWEAGAKGNERTEESK